MTFGGGGRFVVNTLCVIHGTSDATVPVDVSARRSVKVLRNATLSEYEGEPHGLFITAADPLNQELFEYLGAKRIRT
jgi:non-heme chloroperoxidase